VVQNVILKDLAITPGLACLCAATLSKHAASLCIVLDEKQYYAMLRILGTQYQELSFLANYGNHGLANLQKENRIMKVENSSKFFFLGIFSFFFQEDHYYINPHIEYGSMTSIKRPISYEDMVTAAAEKISSSGSSYDEKSAQLSNF